MLVGNSGVMLPKGLDSGNMTAVKISFRKYDWISFYTGFMHGFKYFFGIVTRSRCLSHIVMGAG